MYVDGNITLSQSLGSERMQSTTASRLLLLYYASTTSVLYPPSLSQNAGISMMSTQYRTRSLAPSTPVDLYAFPTSPVFHLNSGAFPCTRSPMMSPNKPKTELKISMTRTLTKLTTNVSASNTTEDYSVNVTDRLGSAASAKAALLPLIPTETPQIKLHMPTVNPAQKSAYPV